MPDLRIRPVREDDRAALAAINAAAAPGVTRWAEGDFEALLAVSRCFLAAEEDGGSVVGYVAVLDHDAAYAGDELVWFRARYGRFLYIDQVAVAKSHRGRGIGARLYAGVEALARREGIGVITCEVNLRPPNPGSIRFHARFGFREAGTLQVSDGRFVSLRVKALGSGEAAFDHS